MFERYKKAIKEWEDECKNIDEKIKSSFSSALKEIESCRQKKNIEERERVQEYNERCCDVCGKSEFIMKYRFVEGKIKGETHGSFSLFGGSIHGYVDGSVDTKPVLSCRSCQNERTIKIANRMSNSELLSSLLPNLYYFNEPTPGSEWINNLGLEVAELLVDELFWYDEKDKFMELTSEAEKVGLVYKYIKPEKPKRYNYIF